MKEGNAAWQALEDDDAYLPVTTAECMRRLRERRKTAGLCIHCGEPSVTPGKQSLCAAHWSSEKERCREAMRRRRASPLAFMPASSGSNLRRKASGS